MSAFILGQGLRLDACGHQANNPSSVCDTRVIDDYEIIYNIGGESYITINDKMHILHKGDMILIPRFTPHKIDTSMENLHENYWIHFNLSPSYESESFMKCFTETWGSYKCSIGIDNDLIALYRRLDEEVYAHNQGDYAVENAIFHQIFIEIIRKTKVVFDRSLASDRMSYLTRQLVSYCYDNYKDITSVEELATYVHISTSYCTQLFRREMNVSPAKFILMLKLSEAARLLRKGWGTVAQISQATGFTTPYHFSNIFKKYYGTSPSDYRKINFMC